MLLLLAAIVAGLLALCWFLHTITWPIVRFVEPARWEWVYLVITPICLFVGGAAPGAIYGDRYWNAPGLLLLAPLTGYAVGLVGLLTTVASTFHPAPDTAEDGVGVGGWRGRLRLFRGAPIVVRIALVAVLVIGSAVAIWIGSVAGHVERGALSAIVIWIAVIRLTDVVRTIRAQVARNAELRHGHERDASIGGRVREAVWGF